MINVNFETNLVIGPSMEDTAVDVHASGELTEDGYVRDISIDQIWDIDNKQRIRKSSLSMNEMQELLTKVQEEIASTKVSLK